MFTYSHPLARVGKSPVLLLLCAAFVPWLGCTAGVKSTVAGAAGTGGGSNPGVGGTSSSGAAGTGTAGSTGLIGGFGGITTNDSGMGCQHTQYTFDPKIPTVYVLVDRSGSMFDCLTTTTNVEAMCGANNQGTPMDTSWYKLKEAARAVLTSLEHDVHFGFATIWGQNPAGGGSCPPLQGMIANKVAPAPDNATAIMTLYDSLPFQPNTTQQGMKFETPASETLDIIGKELMGLTTQGDKYILFITDGQPDYCDDSNSLCAPDSVIGKLQAIKAGGITTIVMGLQANISDLPMGILQAFANAGAGEPTVAPLRGTTGTTFDFYDQCNSAAPPWHADLVAAGKADARGTTLGTYATAAGPTKPYTPMAADQSQLVMQLSKALAGVKSCTFDLTATGGVSIKVDLKQLNKATVKVEGTTIALDPNSANGWNMINETTVQLFGSACDAWRNPDAKVIDFNFPCEIIVE